VKPPSAFRGEVLDLLFDALPVCILDGPDHVISAVNGTFERLFPRRLVGRRFRDAFPELGESDLFWILDDVFNSGEPATTGEVPSSRMLRDGSEREAFISFLVEPLRGPDGKVTGLLAIGTDVSAQVAARRRVEALERRSAFLAEASATLASSLEPGETLATVAQLVVHHFADWCVVDLVGGPADEALGAGTVAAGDPDVEDLLAEIQRRYPPRPGLDDLTGRALHLGQPVLCVDCAGDPYAVPRDPRHRALLERLAPRSAVAVPLRARGQTLGVMTLAWGKTDRRYGAEDVALADEFARHAAVAVDNARLYREAQGGIRVREEFLSIAGHELKTPLTALKLNLQSLERAARREPTPTLSQVSDRITKMGWQLLRLERLMNELLDVSRVTAGRLKLEPERLDLRDLVQEVLRRAEDDLDEAGSIVNLEAPAEVIGEWDPARLDQVVTNLVGNAIKYGLGRPIEVTLTADGASARLTIRDHGIGIAPESRGRIFGRFERAVSDRHYGGFGVGLWIVRQIVEASGGVVRFESEPGRGTTFIVELPLAPPVNPAGS
jgi:signal transduction histidine kinase